MYKWVVCGYPEAQKSQCRNIYKVSWTQYSMCTIIFLHTFQNKTHLCVLSILLHFDGFEKGYSNSRNFFPCYSFSAILAGHVANI